MQPLSLIICILLDAVYSNDYDDYVYEDTPTEKITHTGGERLINARAADPDKHQFVGALFLTSKDKSPKCTVSLISPAYALTAAHCCHQETGLPGEKCNKKPLKVKKGEHLEQYVRCELLPSKDVKIWIEKPDSAYIIFNIKDAKKETDGSHQPGGVISYIEFFIRPYHHYDRDIYHTRGGQDILLIKLEKENYLTPICLPGPQFGDTEVQAKLAGYGKYFRGACLTSSHGPMKYHYCQGEQKCGSFLANCQPKFFDGIRNYTGCVKTDKTPAKWSKLCSKFFFDKKYKFPSNIDEVHLLMISRKLPGTARFLETCYRQDPGEHGWCATQGNYYRLGDDQKKARIATDWGWGFCSEECEQEGKLFKEDMGILRLQEKGYVFDEDYCNKVINLEKYENGSTVEFLYRPELLCVGKKVGLSYEVFFTEDENDRQSPWMKIQEEFLDKNPQIVGEIYKKNMVDTDGDKFYKVSVGSCNGDSGGPLFMTGMDNKNVLTGITRGQINGDGLEECGGIHNPTGYTRVRSLVPWIKSMLSDEEWNQLCFSDRAMGQSDMSENQTSDEKKDEIEDKEIMNTKEDHTKKGTVERTEDFHKRIIDRKDLENKSNFEK